jgi:hypothetical protein
LADIATVLTASAYYARAGSPEMDDREAALKSIRQGLEPWLPTDFRVGDQPTQLEVEIGGRRGGVGPVPWVRVFSPEYSPRATEGLLCRLPFRRRRVAGLSQPEPGHKRIPLERDAPNLGFGPASSSCC